MNYPMYGGNSQYGMNAGMNQGMNQNPVDLQSGAFRNVFGVLGGLQSTLHIFTSLLDIIYFVKAFKTLVIDLLMNLIKRLYRLLKYLVTLKWLFDLISKTNSTYAKFIQGSSYFKYFSITFKFTLILGYLFLINFTGIIACLILKYLKTSQLNSLNSEEEDTKLKNKEDKDDKEEVKKDINEIHFENIDDIANKIHSEERWKLK